MAGNGSKLGWLLMENVVGFDVVVDLGIIQAFVEYRGHNEPGERETGG